MRGKRKKQIREGGRQRMEERERKEREKEEKKG